MGMIPKEFMESVEEQVRARGYEPSSLNVPSMGMDDKYRLTRTGFFSVADNGLYWGVNMMTPTSLEAMDSPVEIRKKIKNNS